MSFVPGKNTDKTINYAFIALLTALLVRAVMSANAPSGWAVVCRQMNKFNPLAPPPTTHGDTF